MLAWISSNGGPLLVLGEELLKHWSGIEAPKDGRVLDPSFRLDITGAATDYDRACSMRQPVAVLPVGGGQGLVLGGEPLDTAWYPANSGEGYLVRWDYADSESAVEDALRALPAEVAWAPVGEVDFDGRVRLFDSAMPGTEIATPSLSIELTPGRYSIESGWLRPDGATSLALVRLSLVEKEMNE